MEPGRESTARASFLPVPADYSRTDCISLSIRLFPRAALFTVIASAFVSRATHAARIGVDVLAAPSRCSPSRVAARLTALRASAFSGKSIRTQIFRDIQISSKYQFTSIFLRKKEEKNRLYQPPRSISVSLESLIN